MNIIKMKHSLALDNAQHHAKKLCVHNHVDWHQQTFYHYSFHELPTDFRSKHGKQLKQLCTAVSDVKQLKRFTQQLKRLADLCPKTEPTSFQNENCPKPILNKIGFTVLSWWTRKTIEQKGVGVYLQYQWKNEVDPVSLCDCQSLPKPFLYTYQDSQKHVYAFDIRTLHTMVEQKMYYNPFTKEVLTDQHIDKIIERAQHLEDLGFNLKMDGENGEQPKIKSKKITKKTIQQIALRISQELDYMGYHVSLEMFMDLEPSQLIKWYIRCEDIWNYRAQLTQEHKNRIVPHVPQGNVFPFKNTIKRYSCRKLRLQKIVFDTIITLITSGVTESEKQTGAIYVLSALTESSGVFFTAFPWLHQPP